ncbi:peptidoglycan-binding protein [Pseudaminobacter arsenicus]|uniref:Peptidoglycan-binding protein n=1 Tax=Borborobacter arsenicus TaxID=1851146 RepID=A0A432VAG4_9HYPH|nr:peptidoglycan-binding domain-containing protein [Pseudaminobacter arsenicus]RUM99169.1 peptidoglycan-binding protein [Pseudaminobacter arsenicus]
MMGWRLSQIFVGVLSALALPSVAIAQVQKQLSDTDHGGTAIQLDLPDTGREGVTKQLDLPHGTSKPVISGDADHDPFRLTASDIQKILNQQGYKAGSESETDNFLTRQAIEQFQADRLEPVTGSLTKEQMQALATFAAVRYEPLEKTLAEQNLGGAFATTGRIVAKYVTQKQISGNPIAILAPTDAAWDAVQRAVEESEGHGLDDAERQALIGCHVVTDQLFPAALQTIFQKRSGNYDFRTPGGCTYSASWSGTGVEISNDAGQQIAVLNDVSAPTVIKVSAIQTRPGLLIENGIRATRIFAGPTQFPPRNFSAYGIVAFPSRASSGDRLDRYLMLCHAYVDGLPHADSPNLTTPYADQMVTVWPVEQDKLADQINKMKREELCQQAVAHYGLIAAKQSIKVAQRQNFQMNGEGPYLIAWAPPQQIGDPNAHILVADLSDVTTEKQAEQIMQDWVTDIERNPELWRNGWDEQKIRRLIQLWVDKTGTKLLSFLKE